MRLESDQVRKTQAVLEAIEVLRDSGFHIEDFEIDPKQQSHIVDVDLSLSIPVNERPLRD